MFAVKCDECRREIRRCETVAESAAGGLCDDCRAELERQYPGRLSPERCAECGELVTVGELERVRSDVDFVEHGDRGHLVRLEPAGGIPYRGDEPRGARGGAVRVADRGR